ncbi:hypothetical protein PMAYCL1PPCAC_29279 [Pristionchus mayeri]|uniref:Gluconokinase n=1 Tax=Pristionchus mayeri TaxID=1317129 RepID=A0AAN5IC03_9BILA|nr:hypothetical protein PMAYCL1PPCAC_29279 [Pristionchus mayeri]
MQMNWDTVVIMGVSGCGKSSVAEEISRRSQWAMIEGDRFHSVENIEKMKKGIPLDDFDRFPWLKSIREEISRYATVIVSCSALKQSYRQILGEGRISLFVFLDVSKEDLLRRLETRNGHFFPTSLLDSQLSSLQRPTEEENALTITVQQFTPIESIVDRILEYLKC